MFAILFFVLAPTIGGVLVVLAWIRYSSEAGNRTSAVVVSFIALAIWAVASCVMLMLDFAMLFGLAHTRPPRTEPFPEGLEIYVITAVYAVLGLGLVALVKWADKTGCFICVSGGAICFLGWFDNADEPILLAIGGGIIIIIFGVIYIFRHRGK
jgi:hypothetical protein